MASIFRSALASRRAPTVFEDGGQMRDFVHVADVARANVYALTAPESVGGVYNVATGEPHTVLEMAQAIAAAYPGELLDPVVVPRYRMGDVRHVFGAVDRLTTGLGFAAEVGFEAGMRNFAAAALRCAVPARDQA